MRTHRTIATALLTTTMLSAVPLIVHAQAAQNQAGKPAETDSTEVIVTAQKRSEKLSNVPISIEVLTTKKLDQLNVGDINDYVALLPSVSFQNSPYQGSSIYFRGVASGGDGNHSGSQPSAGVYLDEQPVTTIGGPLDVHIYDMARIESLAGPQGTLYGASSEAGTIRLITNKPDLSAAYGRFDLDGNVVDHGSAGGKIEGMYNLPLNDKMALRLVGWDEHDAGYIDNVAGSRTFLPDSTGTSITVDNKAYVKNNFNDDDIYGGRAALKIDLDDNWTALVQLMAQDTKTHGSAGYDPSLGDLKVETFYPDQSHDRFYQAALTLTGKIANFDVTYAGAYMERKIDSVADYTDYAEAYDQLYSGVGGIAGYMYFQDNNGNTIDPRQYIVGKDKFTKWSHELRFASPSDQPLRFVGGVFVERQTHAIYQNYEVPGLADDLSVTGHPGTLWLTQQMRIDRDDAIFGELSYDITPTLTATIGGRGFNYDNSLIGFFGMGDSPLFATGDGPPNAAYASSGERRCFTTDTYGAVNPKDPTGTLLTGGLPGTPCTNLGVQNADGTISPKRASGHGFTPKFNLTWKATKDLMVYATWSEGFRPGGINRRGTVPPYAPDYLTNAELGWKVSFPAYRIHWNGAIYDQNWKHFQYSFLGANSFTEVHNGPGARIKGLESDVTWQPTDHLVLTASGAYTDARTTSNLCGYEGDPDPKCGSTITTYETLYDSGSPVLTADSPQQDFISAPKGTRLPITPQVKLSGTARYAWEMGKYKPYWQVQVSNQSAASSDIRTQAIEVGTFDLVDPAALLGKLKGYTSLNLAVGTEWDTWTAEFYVDNLTDSRAQLGRYNECGSCFARSYIMTNRPMTVGLRLGSKF